MDSAVEENTFRDGEAPTPRSDLFGRRQSDIPNAFLEPTAILHFIAKSLGGDQTGERPIHLYQGVVGDGRAVHDGIALPQEVTQLHALNGSEPLQAVHDTD